MWAGPRRSPGRTERAAGASTAASGSPPRPPRRSRWRWRGPKGNPPGGRGLALFYVETRDEGGRLCNIRVNRLKDKLGTRKLPTAELSLEGTPAQLVGEPNHGVAQIVPMLHLTRTWNSVTAAAAMRRGLALARDYASKRVAFGAPLAQQPLHVDTLAGLQAEAEAAFHLVFFLVELIGRDEAGRTAPGSWTTRAGRCCGC